MKTINLIAGYAFLACLSTSFAHESQPQAKTPVVKEQKDWGIAGDARAVNRTVTLTMLDTMRFTPEKIEVKQGETIKIVINNTGAMLHEFVIGTKNELEEHAALMLKYPTMEHSEPYMAHVSPGKRGEIVWTFNKAGNFDFACLIAGHYQAGMAGKIAVVASKVDGHSDHKH